MAKILVTGGAGFIGSHLVDAYLRERHEVIVVDDLSSGTRNNLKGALERGARLYECSLQSPELLNILKREKPELVNHHAAQKSVRDSVSNPLKDAEINIMGLLRLLEGVRQMGEMGGLPKVIFASSGGVVYGEQEEFPASESHPKRPLSPYGVSKYTSELYLDFYCQQWGFSAVALRYANVYGPRQDPEGEAGVVAIFSNKMRKKHGTIIFGTGKQTRDFVFVDDVVQANLKVMDKMVGFKAYNVGTAQETTILELHQKLAQIANYTQKVEFGEPQAGEQLRSVLSYKALQNVTGWLPKISVNEGLRQTYQWFLSQN